MHTSLSTGNVEMAGWFLRKAETTVHVLKHAGHWVESICPLLNALKATLESTNEQTATLFIVNIVNMNKKQ
jgi:hypothetical protein